MQPAITRQVEFKLPTAGASTLSFGKKMKNPPAPVFLALVAVFSGCDEDSDARANRLLIEAQDARANRLIVEAQEIQETTLRAILENDSKSKVDLNEEAQFFESLKDDLEHCRKIEADLRKMSFGADGAQLEKHTTEILLAITEREQRNQKRRQAVPLMTELLEGYIKTFKETGRHTASAQEYLNELKTRPPERRRVLLPINQFNMHRAEKAAVERYLNQFSNQQAESGRRGVLTPAPHTTGHTGP